MVVSGINVSGGEELRKAFESLAENVQGDYLETATRSAARPILNQLKLTNNSGGNTPYLTGDYIKSIRMTTVQKTPTKCTVQLGSDRPQSRRLEYGFTGRDTLGRFYNQEPQPHFRPAFDDNKDLAEREFLAVMTYLIGRHV